MADLVRAARRPVARQRGSIRKPGAGCQLRVTAGEDPASASCSPRQRRRSRRPSGPARGCSPLLAEADALKTARTKASLGYLVDRWLAAHEVEVTTRATYESLIRTYIRPGLESVGLAKLHRQAGEILEAFYGELRRCSRRCDRRPYVEHKTAHPHEC